MQSNDNNHLEVLIQNLSDSFNREMGALRQELRQELRETADRIEGSVKRIESVAARHSKMIVAGTASIAALTGHITDLEGSELQQNQMVYQLQREVADMKIRLSKLEGGRA
jgi:hypothetical protein